MHLRLPQIVVSVMLLGGISLSDAGLSTAQAQTAAPGTETTDLKTRLEKDLQARTPQEFAFADLVVDLNELGILSDELVNGTYLWARVKRPYPFPYFERALRLRAEKLGIKLERP